MESLWRIAESGTVLRVRPAVDCFSPGAWVEVEAYLGVELPEDYKELIGDGRAWALADELWIFSPFDSGEANFIQMAAGISWGNAYLRSEYPEDYPYPLFPEPGGLLAWGTDGNGNLYYWDTNGEPSKWTVVIQPHGDDFHEFDLNLTGFLAALRSGLIDPPLFGDDWPPPDARLERVHPKITDEQVWVSEQGPQPGSAEV